MVDPGARPRRRVDVVVIGGGIAGVGVAAELAPHRSVLLVETEHSLAFHTTGRSAAMYLENYGSAPFRALTRLSKDFFLDPPTGSVDAPLLTPKPQMTVGRPDQIDRLDALAKQGQIHVSSIELIDSASTLELCPIFRPEMVGGAVVEPDAQAIDVAGLHQAYVRIARKAGAEIRTKAQAYSLDWQAPGWIVHTTDPGCAEIACDAVVNAAGSWGDLVAADAGVEPVGLQPMRRTAFTVPVEHDARHWPLVLDVDESFYFKPEGEDLLCSLADETPSPPCDARPEEVDVALAIERINTMTTLDIRHVLSSWAGLRTFAPDRNPVIGPTGSRTTSSGSAARAAPESSPHPRRQSSPRPS